MIAELFYPKELKEIIAELRAKDDLNEKALDHLNDYPLLLLWAYILIYVFRLENNHLSGDFLYLVFIAIVWIFSVWITVRIHFFDKMAAYVLGEKRKGAVFSKIKHSIRGWVYYKFEFVDIDIDGV